jgi:MFS family permease|tara:strand:+ start:279 stop:1553 length:1275 start_codon:yes stop_codon:yes gene_type:complete
MNSTIKNPNNYRWIILAVCFFTITFTNGLTLGGLVVFDRELLNYLSEVTGGEILRQELKLKDAITLWSTAVFAFIAGIIIDRVGVRSLMVSGMFLLSATFYFYAKSDSLADMYIIHIFQGIVLSVSGMVINVVLISKWFNDNRGLAIGVLLAGTSVGNGIFPQINTYLLTISDGDWRQVMMWLALIPLAYAPILFALIKEKPEDVETKEDNEAKNDFKASSIEGGFTLQETLMSSNFWFLSVMAFCTFYSILAMIGHVFLMLDGEGYSPQISATGVSIIFIGGFIGKVISGKLAEMIGRKIVLVGGVAMMLAGSLLIVSSIFYKNPLLIWIGLTLYGTGWGGLYTLIQLLVADLFGLIAIGKIMGVINIIDTIGGGLGPIITAVIYDSTQSYLLPFLVISALLVIALISSSMLKIDDEAIEQSR